MADKTVTSEDREILQTAITNNKNGSNEVEKWSSEIKNTQNGEESSSEFSAGEEEWPSGFPLLRMALLGLPRPQLYGSSIKSKPVTSTNTLSFTKSCGTNTEKPSCVEETKPILFVSIKEEEEEEEEPEDCKTLPDWGDEAAEADSLSDTIYPALLCSPDLHSPSSQDSPCLSSGDADEEQTLSCITEAGIDLLSSSVEDNDLEHFQLQSNDLKRRKCSLQVLHLDGIQKTEDEVNHCESSDKVFGTPHSFSSDSDTCDCSLVFFTHNLQDKLSDTKKFTCTKCGKVYKRSKNLNNHSKRFCRKKLHSDVSVHKVSTAKKLKCDVCDRKFTTNQHLRNHILTHNGKRPYTCDVCGCTFIYKSHVVRHRLTHTKERHYKCDYCSYSFIQKSNFHLHLRSMACLPTPTAKRVCNICYQAFSKKMYLDSHLKKHASIFISTE